MNKSIMKIPKCKKFTGYKPCIPYKNCLTDGCQDNVPSNRIGIKILIIALEGLGAVLSTTTILRALKRKYPVSTIHWLTRENAKPILMNNPLIDKIFIWNDEQRMILRNIKYDVLINTDKTDYACSFSLEINSRNKLGFLLNEDGKIIPASKGAFYNYRMGLDDSLKFKLNKRTGIDILHETCELKYKKDEYVFVFSDEEKSFIEKYKKSVNYNPDKTYIGFNTGCSPLYPNKKMKIEQHVKLIRKLIKDKRIVVVLLGGREDTERNAKILKSFSLSERKKIISTPTQMGIRKGACFMDICDAIITGDSFGMHLAIALRKYVIVWFGLSCWSEIELFGRGVKLFPKNLKCSPCWKKECPYNLECIEMIDLDHIYNLVREFVNKNKKVSVK